MVCLIFSIPADGTNGDSCFQKCPMRSWNVNISVNVVHCHAAYVAIQQICYFSLPWDSYPQDVRESIKSAVEENPNNFMDLLDILMQNRYPYKLINVNIVLE